MDPGLGALCVIRWDLRVLRREGVYFMCGECMNTGYFYISCSVMSDSVTPWTVARQAPRSMGFSRQEYWSGCPSLLHGIFPTQGSNPCLLCCRQILHHLSHQGSPIGSALQHGTTTLEESLAVSYKAKHTFTMDVCVGSVVSNSLWPQVQ